MKRYFASIERTQMVDVEFEAPDDADYDALRDLAMKAATNEWFEAETIDTHVDYGPKAVDDGA